MRISGFQPVGELAKFFTSGRFRLVKRPAGRPSRIPPEVFRFSGLGCVFAAGVLAFTGLGWYLDGRFGSFPALTVVGAVFGSVLSTLSVWRSLQSLDDQGDPPGRRDG